MRHKVFYHPGGKDRVAETSGSLENCCRHLWRVPALVAMAVSVPAVTVRDEQILIVYRLPANAAIVHFITFAIDR
jgi:hypothetical protein